MRKRQRQGRKRRQARPQQPASNSTSSKQSRSQVAPVPASIAPTAEITQGAASAGNGAALDPAKTSTEPAKRSAPGLKLSDVLGPTFWVFAAAALATGYACYQTLGPETFNQSLQGDLDLLLMLMPRFAAAMLIAAFVRVLLPRDRLARYVGDGAGFSAVGIATVVGAMTPGGPMTSFPIVSALRDAGTGRAPLVAYVTSWSTLGFQRIINWELPLMGPEFTLFRILVSSPLPIIAGFMSRLWPAGRDSASAMEAARGK